MNFLWAFDVQVGLQGGVIHDCVPDEMVLVEGNGSQDQLQSVPMRFLLANNDPRLLWCDDRDSQAGEWRVSELIAGAELSLLGTQSCDEIRNMGNEKYIVDSVADTRNRGSGVDSYSNQC